MYHSLKSGFAVACLHRADLRSSLAELPAPENEYSVAMPELPEEEVDMEIEEDAEDIKARKARAAEEARQAAERKKSKVCVFVWVGNYAMLCKPIDVVVTLLALMMQPLLGVFIAAVESGGCWSVVQRKGSVMC